MVMTDDLGVIRQLYDLPTVVARLTGMEARKKIVCPMPFHPHTNMSPSFGMFVDSQGIQRFKCFGNCGVEGDVIDFAGYYTIGQSYDSRNAEHVRLALSYLQAGGMCAPKTPLKKKKKSLDQRIVRPLVKQWEEALWTNEQAQAYLEERGVLSVAKHFRLGYRIIDPPYVKYEQDGGTLPGHYIAIPTIENGRIVSVKLRRIPTYYAEDDIKPIRYDFVSGDRIGSGQPGVFNHDEVAFQSGVVFSPEGEFDVMLIKAHGYLACCMNSGGNVLSDHLALILAHADPIWIADDDDTGQRHAEGKQKLVGKGIIVSTKPHKDLGELYGPTRREQEVLAYLEKFLELGRPGAPG